MAAVKRHNSGKAVIYSQPIIESSEDDAMNLDNVDSEEELGDEDMDLD